MKTKTKKLPRTYKGKATNRRRQEVRWRILLTWALLNMIVLGVLGEHFTNPSISEASVTVPVRDEERINPVLADLDGTPMEGAKAHIIRASEYYGIPEELYLGIAFAESSFKNFKCYNPFGIDTGRGNDPRCYDSWEHSINGFSQLVKYYYLDYGLVTPEALVRKYVGWYNPDWVRNVSTYYSSVCGY